MRVLSLRLKGFTGIYKGMGKLEITLDLSGLQGLIAFDAKNGSGKTTILDCLHPYRRLASRTGSFQHHTLLRESEKAFIFELDGSIYTTLVKIDNHSGRQEGFVWKDDVPQVNGKVSEYDKYIEKLIGSETLFFNSVFCAQGSDKLSDLTAGKLKELFAEFLRLDRFTAWEETAKQAANILQGKADTVRSTINTQTLRINEIGTVQTDISMKNMEKDNKLTSLELAEATLKTLQEEQKELTVKVLKNKADKERIEALRIDLINVDGKIHAGEHKLNGIQREMDDRILDVKRTINANTEAMADKDKIDGMKAELARLEDELKPVEADRKTLSENRDSLYLRSDSNSKNLEAEKTILSNAEKALRDIDQKVLDKMAEIESLNRDSKKSKLESNIQFKEITAGKLDKRDPECKSDSCVFIKDALEAQEDLPAMREELDKLTSDIIETKDLCRDKIKRLNDERDPLLEVISNTESEINALFISSQKIRAEIEKTTNLIHGKNNESQKLGMKIDRLKQEINNQPDYSKLEAENAALKTRQQELESDLQAKLLEANSWLDENRTEKVRIEQQIAGIIIDESADKRLRETEADSETYTRRIDAIRAEISNLDSAIAVLNHQLKEVQEIEVKIKADQSELDRLSTEVSRWRYLQQACGKDGLRALEIDGTAPLISNYANDLLTETFGPGQTIGFRTQNEDGKEVLDIVVYREGDAAEGTLVDKLSGGERVWSLKALRLALTLVSKMKSSRNFLTAFSDEEDGALDAENAMSFIGMYRAFMTAGGFETILYITHRDECKQMADHIIRLSDNGIEIDSMGIVKAA